jgi:exopolyphosphatase/guanosine-5'-triphosphate,3'-diphosphate pyrophosphatase
MCGQREAVLKLYLVRHAKAEKRSRGNHPDELRPLTKSGIRQALGLSERLDKAPIERILSSPAHRCRETVAPLTTGRGLPLELDTRLAETARPEAALSLVRSLGDATAVVCSHANVVLRLLEQLLGDCDVVENARCDKGSAWLVEGPSNGPLCASYLEPLEGTNGRPEDAGSLRLARANGAPSRVAVLDLGSTSFHLLVAEVSDDGMLRRVERERIMLRLGAELGDDSRIPPAVGRLAVESARILRRIAEEAKAQHLIPVATSALREAENGRQIGDEIAAVLGTPVWTLDGEQEARVIFAALRHRLGLGAEPTLGIDLGGGSVEFAVGDADDVWWETTLRLGVARLHGEMVRSDPMTPQEADRIRERTRALLGPQREAIADQQPVRCAAVGGTVRSLARLLLARRRQRSSRGFGVLKIALSELEQLTTALLQSSHEVRLAMPGMNSRRADLLPTGGLVLSTMLAELGYGEIALCDWGLREGMILLEALGR